MCVCESPIVVQVVKSLILFLSTFFCKESIVKAAEESAARNSHETEGIEKRAHIHASLDYVCNTLQLLDKYNIIREFSMENLMHLFFFLF